jgi:hypothetical protein
MTNKTPQTTSPCHSVGYAKPPVETRFPTGQSGNPKGRPKGSKNILTLIEEELAKPVMALVNGKRCRLTTGQAIVKRMVASAAAGSLRAAETLLKYAAGNRVGQSTDPADGPTRPNEQDDAILQRHMARMKATAGRKDDDNE